ncbi:MAG: 3-hydroxyacyl-CoA dehydrogenase, partial [Phycisphaerae bacterium]|nr:3-hydroxyacyl-CoA dehydrogenase [Phycisphaerae bacterium]
ALDRLAEKGKLSPAQRQAAGRRLRVASGPADLRDCELVIEAVVEDLRIKADTLAPIAAAGPRAILASNTSSLSITRIAREVQARLGGSGDIPRRTVGMHFFNPVPLLPLVEVISGAESDPAVVQRVQQVAQEWGKTPVRARDVPGFIVNRVARGFYLESLRMLDEGVAGLDEIDRTVRGLLGFRMGPFELMDMIGIDVNFAVSCSVWEQLGRPARLTPHALQQQLVEQGRLGRKTRRGFYSYESEPPLPALTTPRRSFELPPKLYEAVRRFSEAALAEPGSITEQYLVSRVLVTVMNEAARLLDEGVADGADIDTAMKLGTNYPRGPIEWAERIGRHTCAALLRAMNERSGDGRFEPAEWLVR